MLPAPAARRLFPPEARISVLSLATNLPEIQGQVATRWSLDDLAAAIVNQAHHEALSRSTIWRILEQGDLKPHRSVYWLNSPDPDFQPKAEAIGRLYVDAPRLYEQGRLVLCVDEKTGMQILERKHPTQPAQPGKPEKREHEYIRHGARALIGTFVVPTGQLVWNLGVTRTSEDFVAHLRNVVDTLPKMERYDWVLDNLNTHWSLEVCDLIGALCGIPVEPQRLKTGLERRAFLTDPEHRHVLHFTPKHGSWLNQVELWFGVLARRFLARGSFSSADEFEERLRRFLEDYNAHHAHPYRWTYTGQPLVRDTPFSRTRCQPQRGRGWAARPQRFLRYFYPPRPYRRAAA